MTRQPQQITVAVALLIIVVLSIPVFHIQDVDVEFDWNIDKSQLADANFFQADYAGRCTGREMSDIDGSLVNHCQAVQTQPEAVAMPVDFGYCWIYGCDGIIINYDYNSVDSSEVTVASLPEGPMCETVFCGGDPKFYTVS